MTKRVTKDNNLNQLQEALMSPVIFINVTNSLVTLMDIKPIFLTSEHCRIVTSVGASQKKFDNILALYRGKIALNKLRKQLQREFPSLDTTFIGIYPSLQYPACVYELRTGAAEYVVSNVLPQNRSKIKKLAKYVLGQLLGANPSIGGIGLLVHKR
jgi:hypothetical protein